MIKKLRKFWYKKKMKKLREKQSEAVAKMNESLQGDRKDWEKYAKQSLAYTCQMASVHNTYISKSGF